MLPDVELSRAVRATGTPASFIRSTRSAFEYFEAITRSGSSPSTSSASRLTFVRPPTSEAMFE